MKILKFGGTSVGSAERMIKVAELIQLPGERIVVLSAMAGTINRLVEIAYLLHRKEAAQAAAATDALDQAYKKIIEELLQTESTAKKATEIVDSRYIYHT